MASAERQPLLPSQDSDTAPSHYLATPRAIVYQLTSLLSAVDGLAGGRALTVLSSKQLLATAYGATLDITDIFVAGCLLTAAGSLAGASCGILFLVLLLRPGHHETVTTVIAKEVVFTTFAVFFLVSSIISTVILATGSATLYTPGLGDAARLALIEKLGGSLAYRNSGAAITFVVLGWLSWASMTVSLVLVSKAGRHVLRHGPELRARKGVAERLADVEVSRLVRYFGLDEDQLLPPSSA